MIPNNPNDENTCPSTDPAAPLGPTLEQRAQLVRAYQARACRQADPLRASLGVLTGDLMLIAHGFSEQLVGTLAAGGTAAASEPRFAKVADLYLKVLRQTDRLAHLERLPAPPADPPSRQVRPWREESGN